MIDIKRAYIKNQHDQAKPILGNRKIRAKVSDDFNATIYNMAYRNNRWLTDIIVDW